MQMMGIEEDGFHFRLTKGNSCVRWVAEYVK